MTSQAAFQVLTKQGLSKPYSIPSLLTKKQQGLVHDSSECTSDGGVTYIQLGELLEINSASPQTGSRKARPVKLRKLAATSAGHQIPPETPHPADSLRSDDTVAVPAAAATAPAGEIPQDAPGPASEAKPRRRRLPLQLPPPSDYAVTDNPGPVEASPAPPLADRDFAQPKRRKLPLQIPPPPAAVPVSGYALVSNEPTASTSDGYELPAPTPDFELPKRSSVAEAAAAAMLVAERAAQKQEASRHGELDSGHRQQADSSTENHDDDDLADFDHAPKRSVLKTMATLTIILGGLAATGLMVWQHFDKENSIDLLAITDAQIAALQNSTNNPATLEELSARTQIMSLQLRQLSRAVGQQDTAAIPAAPVELIEAAPESTLPLLPYAPTKLLPEQQADSEAKLSRYARFVRERGPDGRQLDQTSVELYSRHLSDVMQNVSGTTKTRTEALHELAELAKVLYLLQLGNITSSDPVRREDARELLLKSTNAALHALFAELETGDMRFYEVYQAAAPEEQAEMLLIRYWFHRASNRTAADTWLQQMLERMNDSQTTTVQQSIAEANQIEQ